MIDLSRLTPRLGLAAACRCPACRKASTPWCCRRSRERSAAARSCMWRARRPAPGGPRRAARILCDPTWRWCAFPPGTACPMTASRPAPIRLRAAACNACPADPAGGEPLIVLTTVNAVLQRVPPRGTCRRRRRLSAHPGRRVDTEALLTFLTQNGFSRTGTVVDPGDFAVRGGIIDIFPPGAERRCASISSATRWRRSAASIRSRSARPARSSPSRSIPPTKCC